MNNRPVVKLSLTTTDRFLELSGWALLLVFWLYVFIIYSSLPDTIPTHFNAAGEPDAFGNKSNLFVLPAISTALYVGLTYLNRFPHLFNYPTIITEENAVQQYKNSTRMIRILKLVLVVIFALIAYHTLKVVDGSAKGLGEWFLPLVLGLIFLPIVIYFVQAFRSPKSKANTSKQQ